MPRKVMRTSHLAYYRTLLPFEAIEHIAPVLRFGTAAHEHLTAPAASLLRHIHRSASPGRTVDSNALATKQQPDNSPFVLDVLTVEHKGRFVFYLNVLPAHKHADGGYSAGIFPGWNMQRRIVAGTGASQIDAWGTKAHYVTNMPGRATYPTYDVPHVLAASSAPVGVNRSLIITGEHGTASSDTSGFVPEGFECVPWSAHDWSYPLAIPGIDFHDDMNPRVASSLCSHLCVQGDDPRVVRFHEFR